MKKLVSIRVNPCTYLLGRYLTMASFNCNAHLEYGILPFNHFAEYQTDRDEGEADQEEERICRLHQIPALLVTRHLEVCKAIMCVSSNLVCE